MNAANNTQPEKKPPSLGNTLFLCGLCFAAGLFPLLIGLGVISGNVQAGPAGRVLAAVAGLVFIFAGVMVFLRDMAGVQNNQDIPASAPRWIRFGANGVVIAIIACFAGLCSIIAFGPFFSADMLPDMTRQMGSFGAAIFRILMGIFAVIFWYVVIYLILDKIRKRGAE
jgi:cellobiose-specific phosphotransferase system component IIC